MSATELTYDLTEDDLGEVQRQTLAARRERMLKSHGVLAGAVVAAAALAWPLWFWLQERRAGSGPVDLRVGPFLFAVIVAAGVAYPLRRKLGTFRFRSLEAWSLRRMTRRSLRASVLGRISVHISDQGLVRKNATGTLEVPWSQVRALYRSGLLLTLLLDTGRVLVVPRRALPSDEAFQALANSISEWARKPFSEIA